MAKFEIWGPSELSGEITVLGAKNAAMKMIAAAVLIPGKMTLKNVPDILDVQVIIDILIKNGAQINRDGHTLEIDATNLTDIDPDPNLVKKIRGSVVLIGPYLSRFKKVRIPQPGGCVIGARPIETQLDALSQLGVNNTCENEFNLLSGENLKSGLVNLKEASVSATEIIVLASVLLSGQTIIKNAAHEPEIVDLINLLNKAGAKIEGAGTDTINIQGVEKLNPIEYEIIPDRIEAGTFTSLAIVTKSPLKITQCRPEHLESFLEMIRQMGVEFEIGQDFIYIKKSDKLLSTEVKTAIYPGFATDLQAPMGLILTQANGESHLLETLYENRLGYLKELQDMGAKVQIINNREANISGPTPLRGANIKSLDLRAGATLILAGLAAEGKTVIEDAEIIDRGYEKIEERLAKVGAKIKRI